jgi:prepilin-type N-terminal cleavage/methylation domain-containing protein
MNEDGFSLPELLSVMVVSSLFAGLILYFGFSYWRYGFLLEADLDTYITRLNAGDYLREAVGGSTGLINQNSIPDANTLNADPLIGSGEYWDVIHAIPGNTTVGASGTTTPLLYFSRPSQNTTGAFIMNGTQPYRDEFVLYLNGSTKQLLARTIANPSATGNKLVTSCPPDLATSTCPADKVVARDIASVDMRYFSRSGNTLDFTSSTDAITGDYNGPDFSVTEVVEFTLNLTKKPIFQKTNATQNSTIVRIALRNS